MNIMARDLLSNSYVKMNSHKMLKLLYLSHLTVASRGQNIFTFYYHFEGLSLPFTIMLVLVGIYFYNSHFMVFRISEINISRVFEIFSNLYMTCLQFIQIET